MKLFSFNRSAILAIIIAFCCNPTHAEVKSIPFHLHSTSSSTKALKARDFESQEIINRNLDAYLIIDHVECQGASLKEGEYGIFISAGKSEPGYVRFYLKRAESLLLTRAGIVANNFQNLPMEPPFVKLVVNDRDISIPQPQMAQQRNNPDMFTTCLSEKFDGVPLDYVEINVPYIEGTGTAIQLTSLRLVYKPEEKETTELEFAVKEHVGYLSESYEMPELKASKEEHLRFVTLSSSDEKVAAIAEGKVSLKGEGEATISAKIEGVASIADTKEVSYKLIVYKDRQSAIEAIDSDPRNWTYYDLDGRRLSSRPTSPGIYVAKNGSKTIKFIISSNR